MKILQEVIKNLALLLIFAFFLELLLPQGKYKGYIQTLVGLFIIATLLNPLLTFFNENFSLILPVDSQTSNQQMKQVLERGMELEERQAERAISLAKNNLEGQLEEMISFVYGIPNPKVNLVVEGGSFTEISIVSVEVILKSNFKSSLPMQVEPIKEVNTDGKIQLTKEEKNFQSKDSNNKLLEQIRAGIGAYLDLPFSKIKIFIEDSLDGGR